MSFLVVVVTVLERGIKDTKPLLVLVRGGASFMSPYFSPLSSLKAI